MFRTEGTFSNVKSYVCHAGYGNTKGTTEHILYNNSYFTKVTFWGPTTPVSPTCPSYDLRYKNGWSPKQKLNLDSTLNKRVGFSSSYMWPRNVAAAETVLCLRRLFVVSLFCLSTARRVYLCLRSGTYYLWSSSVNQLSFLTLSEV